MRVLIGAISHESNTFTPFLTTTKDFDVRYGADILEEPTWHGSFWGIVTTLQAHHAELIPTVTASAMPGGLVERSTYEAFKQKILKAAHDVDGVCLHLHGAMRAEGLDCCENDLLRGLRAKLGPDAPIVIALDTHANIVAGVVKNVDAMVAYQTVPHVDTFETGEKAAQILLRILEEGVKTVIGFAKIPFLLPGEMAQTSRDPMMSMMKMVKEIEQYPGVLSASLTNSHCWADVPDIGVAAVVVARGDAELAQAEANRLAGAFWARRTEFGVSVEAYPVEEAVGKAMTAREPTVFLSDSGDNPRAGGTTDIPALLEALLTRQTERAVVASIWDAEAVQACTTAGVGQDVTLSIGGKVDTRHGTPLEVTGTVRLLADGDEYQGGVRKSLERGTRGPIAVLNTGGVDVILSSTRLSFSDPAQLRNLGLEPLEYRIVALKRGYLPASFQAISERSILALSPGVTNCDVTQLPFTRVNRPIYPLDPDMTWSPD